jgi:RNA polymerase sigma-70 factor (ECF subfamily)
LRVDHGVEDPATRGPDAELLAGLRRREPRAFAAAYERHRVRIYSFLFRLCGRRDLADDLFQETFLQLARHAPHLRPDTELAAWLYTVARNRYRSHRRTALLRKLRLLPSSPHITDAAAAAGPSTPLDHALHDDLGRQLERALAHLGEAQREVLLLVAVEGVEQDQAAKILGLSPAALRQRLARARAQVQQFLARVT